MSYNLKAAMMIMLAMSMISSNDAIVKINSQSLHIGQILFIRGAAACLIFAIIIKLSRKPLLPPLARSPINLIRASCETGATLMFVTGLSLLPIATASTLVWTAPLMLTILAALVLREPISVTRWLAVFVGFIGILFVTNPVSTTFTWTMLLPLAAAVLVSCRDVVTRRLNPKLHSLHVTFVTLLAVTLVGFLISIYHWFFNWNPVDLSHVMGLTFSAILLSGGFFFQVSAIRLGELSFVAPFAYTGIVVAVFLGIVIWNEIPTVSTLFGIVLIAVSGLAIVRTEKLKK